MAGFGVSADRTPIGQERDEIEVIDKRLPADYDRQAARSTMLVDRPAAVAWVALTGVLLICVLAVSSTGPGSVQASAAPHQPEATQSVFVESGPIATQPVPTLVPTEVRSFPLAEDTVIPTPTGPNIGEIIFTSELGEDGQPINPGDTFTGGVTQIHAFFSYQGMVDGMPWERRWYRDGNKAAGGSGLWDAGAEGVYRLSLNSGGQPLDAGVWKLEIYVNERLMRTGTFMIEVGVAPGPTSAPTPLGTSSTPVPATPTAPPETKAYTIAFARWDGGKHNLYLASTKGGEERFLLQRAAGPSWSPDGQYLAFHGAEGIDRQEREGSEYEFPGITNGIIRLNMATWSLDLRQVELMQFVREGTARSAAWSPDGRLIAYEAQPGGGWTIFLWDVVANQPAGVEIPGEQMDWSPDSSRLVYRSGRDNRQGIWISNQDGSGSLNITNDGSDAFPRWSPDGRKIAFHREVAGNVDIYLMNTDGSHIRRLTNAPGSDTLPAWTPDGQIVFRSARTGSWGIYIMNADSSGQQQIIANADPGPDWAYGRMDVR